LFVIDNLRYDQWKTFESEVSNYYKLEKKSLFLYSSYGDPICSKRDFLWFDTTKWKTVSAYWKNDPEEGGKTYMKLSFISATKTLGLNIKEDYFKITNLTAGKK
jgi:hypothetical protein